MQRNIHSVIYCPLHAATKGVSVAQRLGRRASDLPVMGLIPGPGVISHLGQLSLPSLRGRLIEYQPSPAGVKAGCVRLCRMASNIV